MIKWVTIFRQKGGDGMAGPALGCVLMASGQGKRFGGDKLTAPFGGGPMLCRVLAATDTPLITRRVAVTRSGEIAELCRQMGVEAVLHGLPHRSDTVRLGLETLGDGLAGCLFCPCDQPLLTRASVEALCGRFAAEPGSIWRLAWRGEAGSPILFPADCFPALMALPEGEGGSYLVRAQPERVRLAEASSPWELRDVDAPENLRELLEHIK